MPAKPRLIRALQGGRTNQSFLVECGAHLGVVRINAHNSANLGIDRERELSLLRLLQSLECVPRVWFASQEVLVTEFVDGRQWHGYSLQQPRLRRRLARLIERLQGITLTASMPRFSYRVHCENYLQQLEDTFPDGAAVVALAATLDEGDWQPVICHHDLVPENIVETERGLVLLDWEYAGWGHPAMDGVRLYGRDFPHPDTEKVYELQQAMDRLWQAVQNQLINTV